MVERRRLYDWGAGAAVAELAEDDLGCPLLTLLFENGEQGPLMFAGEAQLLALSAACLGAVEMARRHGGGAAQGLREIDEDPPEGVDNIGADV